MTYDDIIARLETTLSERSGEERLARAGLKPAPDLTGVYERSGDLFSQETISAVRELMTTLTGKEERDRIERVLFTLLEGVIARQTAPLDEEIARESFRSGLRDFPGRIANEPDGSKREQLRAEEAALYEKTNPKRLEREKIVRKGFASFGFGSVREYAGTKKRVDYDEFLHKIVPVLEETTGLYRRVMSEMARRALGREIGDIDAAHASWLFSHHEFDHHFPGDRLSHLTKMSFERMGLDLDRATSVEIDAEEREGKDPRAGCVPVRVPNEVHLIFRPQGGYPDYRGFMHAGIRALHFAYTDPTLPLEWRRLSRSDALYSIFAFTMERLAENPLWLEHALQVPKTAAETVAARALLGDLFVLRRTIAKFTYELSFDAAPLGAMDRKAYPETLKDLTGCIYPEAFYLKGTEGLFASADDLRARIAAAQLEEHLVRTYGDRWFLKRETGEFFRALFKKGASKSAEDLITDLGMTAWDPLPLIQKYDNVKKLLR